MGRSGKKRNSNSVAAVIVGVAGIALGGLLMGFYFTGSDDSTFIWGLVAIGVGIGGAWLINKYL